MQWFDSLELSEWIGLFGLLLAFVGIVYTIKAYNHRPSKHAPIIDQNSEGEQSPVINAKGNVEISYGQDNKG